MSPKKTMHLHTYDVDGLRNLMDQMSVVGTTDEAIATLATGAVITHHLDAIRKILLRIEQKGT